MAAGTAMSELEGAVADGTPWLERTLPTQRLFGLDVTDITLPESIELVDAMLSATDGRSRSIFFVNAHTLNVAHTDADYTRVLASADRVFGDGTGVRWASRILHETELRDNVNGTDLTPAVLETLAGKGYRYYLLGGTAEAIERTAEHAREHFAGWELVGHHHGYLDDEGSRRVVEEINAARPHLLLVGMGNPLQERWIATHRESLRVPLSMGIGGLLSYWSGEIERAPRWMRRLGIEWIHLLLSQPRKFERYVLGNPLFLARVLAERRRARGA